MANSKEQKLILGGKTKLYYSKASVIGLFLGPRNLKTYNVASHWTTQINTFFKKYLQQVFMHNPILWYKEKFVFETSKNYYFQYWIKIIARWRKCKNTIKIVQIFDHFYLIIKGLNTNKTKIIYNFFNKYKI